MSESVFRGVLVFIHGSGDSAGVWDRVISHLAGYDCVALDLPGHGARAVAPGPERVSVADYAEAVRDELARRGLVSVVLVGHSLGSAVALRLAVDAPELVGRLVLVGAGARLRVLPSLLEGAHADPLATDRRLAALAVASGNEALARAWVEQRPLPAQGMLYRDLAACDAFDMMAELGRVAQPTLVVTGAEDRLTPPKYATYLHDHIPNAQLVLVPHAGHYVMLEAPTEVAEALRRWLV
jgi:pimeloyl-ACP methyl ester carboxylesterase